MRGTRDAQMAEMTALKAKLKEQNNRLVAVTAEKARLEAKNKKNQESQDANKESMAEATTNKQIALKQLKDRLADLETEVSEFIRGSCQKRQKPQAPTPQAPIRNRQTRKVAHTKGLNRNTNLT